MRTLQTMSVYVWPIRLVTQTAVRQLGKSLMHMGFSDASIDALNYTMFVPQSDHNARKVVIGNGEKCLKCSDCDTAKVVCKQLEVNHEDL